MTALEPYRICVVCADYSGSDGALSQVDNIERTPAFHCSDPRYAFETLTVHKKDVYFMLRKAATKTHPDDKKRRYYDCFFIIADGALDEDRSGIEVLQVLERFGCAFTGARSPFYELTKPEMKVLAMRNSISTARFAVLEAGDDVRASCARLSFPLIVKHISGYSSVGMTKKNKVKNMEELEAVCADFIAEYQSALVEEFVSGVEVTALACADSTQPGGCRVYPPVYVTFPEGEDFKHFDLKWIAYEDMQWKQVPDDHPSMAEIIRVTRVAFQSMMQGVGYGRVDLRIDEDTGDVVLLEINPNCGIMYPLGQEASADFILELAGAREDFVTLQIQEALLYQKLQQPMFQVRLDGSRELGWTTRATRNIACGTTILSLAGNGSNNSSGSNYHQYQQKLYKQIQEQQQQQQNEGKQEKQNNQNNNKTSEKVQNEDATCCIQDSQSNVGVRLISQQEQNHEEVITQLQSIVTNTNNSNNNNNNNVASAGSGDGSMIHHHSNTLRSPSASSAMTDAHSGNLRSNAQQHHLSATSQPQQQQNNHNNRSHTPAHSVHSAADSASDVDAANVCIFPSVTMVPLNNNTLMSATQEYVISQQQQQQQQLHNNNVVTPTGSVSGQSVALNSNNHGEPFTMTHQQQQQQNQNNNNNNNHALMKFGLALNDPQLTCSHIIGGGIPFPKANCSNHQNSKNKNQEQQQKQQEKQTLEFPNVVFDRDSLCFVATADIKEGEEILC